MKTEKKSFSTNAPNTAWNNEKPEFSGQVGIEKNIATVSSLTITELGSNQECNNQERINNFDLKDPVPNDPRNKVETFAADPTEAVSETNRATRLTYTEQNNATNEAIYTEQNRAREDTTHTEQNNEHDYTAQHERLDPHESGANYHSTLLLHKYDAETLNENPISNQFLNRSIVEEIRERTTETEISANSTTAENNIIPNASHILNTNLAHNELPERIRVRHEIFNGEISGYFTTAYSDEEPIDYSMKRQQFEETHSEASGSENQQQNGESANSMDTSYYAH